MAKKITYIVKMKDGSEKTVEGTEIIPDYAYDKRVLFSEMVYNKKGEAKKVESTTYILTHTPTGTLITSSDKVNSLKLLCSEPEFFEPFDALHILKAVIRFWNKYDWKDPKIA